jgi:hypothetical protein
MTFNTAGRNWGGRSAVSFSTPNRRAPPYVRAIPTTMTIHPPTALILLLFGLLTSGSGCQILHIPSYRVHEGTDGGELCSDFGPERPLGSEGPSGTFEGCEPGFLPPAPTWVHAGFPVPGWWAEWKAKRNLPEPAPYPRFQPLPTRPMFSPRPDTNAAGFPLGMPPTVPGSAVPWPAVPPQPPAPMGGSNTPSPPVQAGYGRLP